MLSAIGLVLNVIVLWNTKYMDAALSYLQSTGYQINKASIIVLKSEVANVFPNKEAVNKALLSLIELSSKTIRVTKRTSGRAKKLRSS